MPLIEHSYKDFHCEGLDYICLERSPDYTKKVYFFDRIKDLSIVNPHNHGYDFVTTVLQGNLVDTKYDETTRVIVGGEHHKYWWNTPLNGGKGFEFWGQVFLRERSYCKLGVGGEVSTDYRDIHTIHVTRDTVLLLEQFEDKGPGRATNTYFSIHKPLPALDVLYQKFEPREFERRVKQYEKLMKTLTKRSK